MSGGWIGVDLDGTLALYSGWVSIEHVGPPVDMMLQRVKNWIEDGRTVKIFTARVSVPEPKRSEVIRIIQDWCEKHGLPRLEVTNVKDFGMVELWDDRAIGVVPNHGTRIGGEW